MDHPPSGSGAVAPEPLGEAGVTSIEAGDIQPANYPASDSHDCELHGIGTNEAGARLGVFSDNPIRSGVTKPAWCSDTGNGDYPFAPE